MSIPHHFQFLEKGNKSPHGDGEWHQCAGCKKKVFFPNGWSDFQKELTITLAWSHDVSVLDPEEFRRRTIQKKAGESFDKGYHGILAEDCEEAQKFVIEHIMLT